jgi:hypothetical protein
VAYGRPKKLIIHFFSSLADKPLYLEGLLAALEVLYNLGVGTLETTLGAAHQMPRHRLLPAQSETIYSNHIDDNALINQLN